MTRPRRPVKYPKRKGKREESTEPFDKWLTDAAALKESDPARYEREVQDVVKLAVENWERVTKG